MNISDAKKVIRDKVNLDIEAAQLMQDIHIKEKQIKKCSVDVNNAEENYNELQNSKVKQLFLGLTGQKATRLQEAQNEWRRLRGELASAEFEISSLKARAVEIEQTSKEIESVYKECLDKVGEVDGETIKRQIQSIKGIPNLCDIIGKEINEINGLIKTSYDLYEIRAVRDTRASFTIPGTFINKDYEMRKQSERIADAINQIISSLDAYNQIAPSEIQIEFYEKWMDNEKYWENQAMSSDTMQRIQKVEDWVYRLEMCWKGMKKQQTATMQKLQEEVLAYLDV